MKSYKGKFLFDEYTRMGHLNENRHYGNIFGGKRFTLFGYYILFCPNFKKLNDIEFASQRLAKMQEDTYRAGTLSPIEVYKHSLSKMKSK